VLTRQGVPILDPDDIPDDAIERGAYVLRDPAGGDEPQLILIGTGSEVSLCLGAAERLEQEGIPTRVVSMPCFDRFGEQDAGYRDMVLPPSCRARVSVEAAATLGWERWVGDGGESIGMLGFGASGPAKGLLEHFGFTVENVAECGRRVVENATARAS
jgi:transketolase